MFLYHNSSLTCIHYCARSRAKQMCISYPKSWDFAFFSLNQNKSNAYLNFMYIFKIVQAWVHKDIISQTFGTKLLLH